MVTLLNPVGRVFTSEGWLDLGSTSVVPDPDPDPPEGFPVMGGGSTGPRFEPESTHNGNYTTSEDGEVIDRMVINGRLTIQHDNVVVRDSIIRGSGSAQVTIAQHVSAGRDTVGVLIEWSAIDGINSGDDSLALNAQGGWTMSHCWVYNVNRALYVRRNCRIEHSYINNTRTFSGAHREAIEHHGGGGVGGIEIYHNTLLCDNTGTSGAVALYGDFSMVQDVLVENNLMASRSYYILYGGSVSGKPYPEGEDVRVINNHFSTQILAPNGSVPTPITGLDAGQRGNVSSGNVWHETGDPI